MENCHTEDHVASNGFELQCVLKKAAQGSTISKEARPRPCNLCGSVQSHIILQGHKRVHSPRHLVIYRYCLRCSFIFLDLDYDQWLSTYYRDCREHSSLEELRQYADQEEEETWSVIQDVERVYPSIREGHGKVAADIGAGAGGSLRVYRSMGWHVTGVEAGKRQVEFAKTSEGLNVQCGIYSDISFEPETIDWIHCYHTLEHLTQPYRALRCFYRHLKPKGLLYVEVPNVIDTSIYQLGFDHLSMFSPGTLRQSLEACGFQVLHLCDRSHYPTFGIGFLCRKMERSSTGDQTADLDGPYISLSSISPWSPDHWFPLQWKLWYAFYIGRGREALTWRAPIGLLKELVKPFLKPLVMSLVRTFEGLTHSKSQLQNPVSSQEGQESWPGRAEATTSGKEFEAGSK